MKKCEWYGENLNYLQWTFNYSDYGRVGRKMLINCINTENNSFK